MSVAHTLRRYSAALGLLLIACPCAFALNPSLDVSQYAHTPWRFRDGFTKGEIYDIAQTQDGYLWLGTSFGLYRFDGVNAVLWQPPADQPFPSSAIRRLLAARDGTIWIGTTNGLARWKNAKLTQYSDLSGFIVSRLIEDHAGSVWVGARDAPRSGKLCEVRDDGRRCTTETGAVMGLHEDGKGNLWVGSVTGVWRWKPVAHEFFPAGEANGIQDMADDLDGSLLIPMVDGVRRLVDGKSRILARPISTFGEGLAADQDGRRAPDFRVAVEGTSRDLAPLVRDEVYRIVDEALRNAFRHAGARRIEVEIHYEKWLLRMRVRDDGKGIDPHVVAAGSRGGRYGLPGMRERADLVGGKLAVWSELNSGTEIELTVPSAIAYAKSPDARQVAGQPT